MGIMRKTCLIGAGIGLLVATAWPDDGMAQLRHPIQLPQADGRERSSEERSRTDRSPGEGQPAPRSTRSPADNDGKKKTIYKWEDAQGTHFTDDPTKIPEAYRDEAQEREVRAAPNGVRSYAPDASARDGADTHVQDDDEPTGKAAWSPEDWRAYAKDIVRSYRQQYEQWKTAGYTLNREISVGAPPGRIQEIRDRRAALAQELHRLYDKRAGVRDEIREHGGNTRWVDPVDRLDLPAPPPRQNR